MHVSISATVIAVASKKRDIFSQSIERDVSVSWKYTRTKWFKLNVNSFILYFPCQNISFLQKKTFIQNLFHAINVTLILSEERREKAEFAEIWAS